MAQVCCVRGAAHTHSTCMGVSIASELHDMDAMLPAHLLIQAVQAFSRGDVKL